MLCKMAGTFVLVNLNLIDKLFSSFNLCIDANTQVLYLLHQIFAAIFLGIMYIIYIYIELG